MSPPEIACIDTTSQGASNEPRFKAFRSVVAGQHPKMWLGDAKSQLIFACGFATSKVLDEVAVHRVLKPGMAQRLAQTESELLQWLKSYATNTAVLPTFCWYHI
jgi:hypothetical protein